MIHPIIITSNGEVGEWKYNCYTICNPIPRHIILEVAPYIDIYSIEDRMPDPKTTETTSVTPVTEEFKDQNQKYNLSKFEFDLYHEEYDTTEKVIRVKRVNMPNKGEKWKIMEDNKVMFILEGTKLNNKERDFLRTPDGFNFLIAQYKLGIKSFNALKVIIKKKLK